MLSIKPHAPVCLVAVLVLGGCVVAGGGMEDLVDRDIVTGSIAPSRLPADQLSDRRMIRNAISSADLATESTQTFAWANSDTGASGVISAIREERGAAGLCRSFRTSRQRFDGIALYDGEACTRGAGEWVLTRFSERG